MEPISATVGGVAGALHIAAQVRSTLKSGHDTVKGAAAYVRNGSLADIAKVARVEPIMLVDADCMHVDFLPDLTQSILSIFSGYYMQAMDLLGTIGGVTIASKLAPLNPARGIGFEDRKDWRYASESYKYRLPTTHNKRAVAMESQAVMESMITDKENITTAKDVANLSVGKMFNVTICEGESKRNVPVSIRLMTSTIPTSSIINMLTFKDSIDTNMTERFHAWRAGRLHFIKDIVLCNDLIDKHRKLGMTDKSGVYLQILGRENGNVVAGLMNKNPSLATASNIAVISKDTLSQMELKLSGRFDNFKVRQAIFDSTNLILVAVVDKQWSRVTFYHRGMLETTTVSERDMKAANKGGGDNVLDIMKAFMAGSAPTL